MAALTMAGARAVPSVTAAPTQLTGRFCRSMAPASLGLHQRPTSSKLEGARSVAARVAAPEAPAIVPWWERPAPENVKHIESVQDMVDQLAAAREQLVIVKFFAPWCGACKALYPKIGKLAKEHPDILFLCVNFDESRTLVKGLNVKVLPYFHLYRGAEGRVAEFTASTTKVQRIRDAIALHNTPRCSLGAPPTLEEFPEVTPGASAVAAAAIGSDAAGSGSSSPFSGTIGGVESLADCKPCSFDFSP